MKKWQLFATSLIAIILIRKRPKYVKAQSFPAGTLLFSPIGKKESFYVGHVGIVTNDLDVIHSIPSGIKKDQIEHYFCKFRLVTAYIPVDKRAGQMAASYAKDLQKRYPQANYRFMTPLHGEESVQYCTKIVWQAYLKGAGIKLSMFPGRSCGVHPIFLKSKKHFIPFSRDVKTQTQT